MIPLVFILFASIIFISNVGDAVTAFREGGIVRYDEEVFQDYANERYMEEFGSSTAYEDNILIVFLTDESCEEFYCIAWVGDHISTPIYKMFGDESTTFGRTMISSINAETYKYSLSSNLARAVELMELSIKDLGQSSSHSCTENHTQVPSHLTNRSELTLTEATVNDALTRFTASTDIPIVIVVDEMEDVFGKTMPFELVLTLLVAAVFIGVGIYLIVRVVKNNKKKGDGDGGNRYAKDDGNGGGYSGYTNDRSGNFR